MVQFCVLRTERPNTPGCLVLYPCCPMIGNRFLAIGANYVTLPGETHTDSPRILVTV